MTLELVEFGNHVYVKGIFNSWPTDFCVVLDGQKWHSWEVKVDRVDPNLYFVLMITQEEFDKRVSKWAD